MKRLLFFCLCAALLLAGCASPAPAGREPSQPLAEIAPARKPSQPPEETALVRETAHAAPEPGFGGLYQAEPQRFSQEDVDRFLSCQGDSVADLREEALDGSLRRAGRCQSGKELLYLEASGAIPHVVFQYYDPEKYRTYHDYPIYSNEESYETNARYTVGWMFTEPRDFSFATAREAEEDVRAALAALGVTDLTLLRTLYIDHDTMAQAGKKLATDPAYAPIGEPQPNNGYSIREDWSQADDAYLFSFGLSLGDGVLSTRFELRETEAYLGSAVIVWYSKDGIDVLHMEMPWKLVQPEGEPGKLVSPQEALEVIKEKMSGILAFRNTAFFEPVLEYQYRQEKDRWLLFPVWTVRVSYEYEGDGTTYYRYECVDALTGKEL